MCEYIEIVFEEENKDVIHKKKFVNNKSNFLFNNLINEEKFQYVNFFKRSVTKIDQEDIIHHPTVFNIKKMIEKEYKVYVLGVFVNYYTGDDFAPYHRDSYGVKGMFTVSLGGSRMFYIKNDKSSEVTKYLLEDGDLFYFNDEFNSKNKHSIPKLKNYKSPRISILFFTN